MTQQDLPSDEERAMLRDSVRGFLARHWPSSTAMEWATDPTRVKEVWRQLADQGLTALGSDRNEGVLREITITMEEMGRAACPVPLHHLALLHLAGLRTAAGDEHALFDEARTGEARVLLALGAFDGDRSAGSATMTDNTVSGELSFMETADSATHFAVAVAGPGLALVDASAPGVRIEATPAMGAHGMSRVTLHDVPATLLDVSAPTLYDLQLMTRLALSARAGGAAARAFEMAVAYAGERKQFGRLIGSFQAIQHKLANNQIALMGTQLTLANAARQHDLGTDNWRVFASAACAAAGATLRQVALETQHTFGAIGYSEEHEAPRHFKQVHLDVLRHGGVRRSKEELAEYFLGDVPHALPEYDLGPQGNAFREEVRAWLKVHWSGERKAAHDRLGFKQREYDRDFARDLGKTGWIGLGWPERFGGQARGAFEQLAFVEEMERAEAPRAGAPVQAAMLQVHGTPAQQDRYLPQILRGEAIYGMGYSEPDSGSDLASMRTRAVRDGDHYVINGQKIWTTTYWGEYMLLATRTDPEASPPHAGLSLFIVPMDTPGITVKTSTTLYGGSFANVFYDNVRVPADAMVGELNGGWKVLVGALATERGFIGGGIVMKVAHAFELLCDYIRGAQLDGRAMRLDPLVRGQIGELASQIEVGRQMMMHCAERVDAGETPLHDAAASKVYSGELMERFGEVALDILGMEGTLSEGSPGALLQGRIEQNLRHSLMWVISIGTNEIQRTLIAQRGLGLPR
ncbi:acyl-CoA dehydrogenase family protein [Variovorax sp. GB1R11]|uniref:acyl-CoA dehydrogenase family protein n=1 Tax=Variovorax sp. GB1R11 TaxID=3443741 RepID=UPI003F482387